MDVSAEAAIDAEPAWGCSSPGELAEASAGGRRGHRHPCDGPRDAAAQQHPAPWRRAMPTMAAGGGGLDAAQKAEFEAQGFLLLHDLLPPEVLSPLIAEFDAAVGAKAEALLTEGRVAEAFAGAPFDRRLSLLCESAEPAAVQELWQVGEGKHQKTAAMFALLTHPPLLDVVQSVCGSSELLAHPQFNSRAKLPADVLRRCAGPGMAGTSPVDGVKYHQDAALLEREVDLNTMCNLWVPLVNAPLETGPLRVIPASHRWGLVDPSYPPRGVIEQCATAHPSLDAAGGWAISKRAGASLASDDGGEHWQAVDCPVPLGGALLIHERLMHCSSTNSSGPFRAIHSSCSSSSFIH